MLHNVVQNIILRHGIIELLRGCLFENDEYGVSADLKGAVDAKVVDHNPFDLASAMEKVEDVPNVFGVFYKKDKPCYDELLLNGVKQTPKKDRSQLLDSFKI